MPVLPGQKESARLKAVHTDYISRFQFMKKVGADL